MHTEIMQKRSVPTQYTSQALNTTPYNLLPTNGGPVIFYNGSGDVQAYKDGSPIPNPISSSAVVSNLKNELVGINNNSVVGTSCQKCLATTELFHVVAITQPVEGFTNLTIQYCKS